VIEHFQVKDPENLLTLIEGRTYYKTIAGNYVASIDELHIAHYLTVNNIPFMYQKELMLLNTTTVTCTFYLPECQLMISYHPENVTPEELSQQLTQQTELEKPSVITPFTTLFVNAKDVSDIDKVLAKTFNQLGVSV